MCVLGVFSLSTLSYASEPGYPQEWWKEIPRDQAHHWETLPQDAGPGEVILSKRTELGLFSNFTKSPFEFRGESYASIEGFWQATKYPENRNDERARFPGLRWRWTREQVKAMDSYKAKEAGDLGSQNMKIMGIDWVTFETEKMVYKEKGESEFYFLVREVMKAKLQQNPRVKELLLQTGNLKLRPDHTDLDAADLLAWQYHEIWMQMRRELREHSKGN